MRTSKLLWRWTGRLLGPSIFLAALGCAAGYHDVPCGRVAYDYCPPPPLPYAKYWGCPTPTAAKRRSLLAPPQGDEARRRPERGDGARENLSEPLETPDPVAFPGQP